MVCIIKHVWINTPLFSGVQRGCVMVLWCERLLRRVDACMAYISVLQQGFRGTLVFRKTC